MQIITKHLYVIVNREKYLNNLYFDVPRYSYTSITEAMRESKDTEYVVELDELLRKINERNYLSGIGL